MAAEDWKSTIIILVLSLVIFRYFVNVPKDNRAFFVGKSYFKYHANWTKSLKELEDITQLQKAYQLPGINSIDVSFYMSSLNFESLKNVLPVQFQQYRSIKLNFGNNPIGTAGADYILSLIPNQVEELDISLDSIDADL